MTTKSRSELHNNINNSNITYKVATKRCPSMVGLRYKTKTKGQDKKEEGL